MNYPRREHTTVKGAYINRRRDKEAQAGHEEHAQGMVYYGV